MTIHEYTPPAEAGSTTVAHVKAEGLGCNYVTIATELPSAGAPFTRWQRSDEPTAWRPIDYLTPMVTARLRRHFTEKVTVYAARTLTIEATANQLEASIDIPHIRLEFPKSGVTELDIDGALELVEAIVYQVEAATGLRSAATWDALTMFRDSLANDPADIPQASRKSVRKRPPSPTAPTRGV